MSLFLDFRPQPGLPVSHHRKANRQPYHHSASCCPDGRTLVQAPGGNRTPTACLIVTKAVATRLGQSTHKILGALYIGIPLVLRNHNIMLVRRYEGLLFNAYIDGELEPWGHGMPITEAWGSSARMPGRRGTELGFLLNFSTKIFRKNYHFF